MLLFYAKPDFILKARHHRFQDENILEFNFQKYKGIIFNEEGSFKFTFDNLTK